MYTYITNFSFQNPPVFRNLNHSSLTVGNVYLGKVHVSIWLDLLWGIPRFEVNLVQHETMTSFITASTYHRFRWYATLENKTPAETFPKFPSILRVIDRSDPNPPITATSVTLWPSLRHISGCDWWDFDPTCRITRKTDGNFGNVSAGVLFSKVAHQRKR